MSIGPAGAIAQSIAGSPLAQTRGSDVLRGQQDATAQQRVAQNEVKAEAAGGVGQTDGEDHATAERDADGRLPWQRPDANPEAANQAERPATPSRDPDGQSGNQLDLSG